MRRFTKGTAGIPVLSAAMVVGACLMLVGCGSQSNQSATPPAATPAAATSASEPAASGPKRYDLRGKVVAVDKAGKSLTVDGEDIPGFMMAMTMGYPVKDAALLEHLSPGDQITAKVVSSDGNYWLEDVAPAGKPTPSK